METRGELDLCLHHQSLFRQLAEAEKERKKEKTMNGETTK
jgi:hypothetical protein